MTTPQRDHTAHLAIRELGGCILKTSWYLGSFEVRRQGDTFWLAHGGTGLVPRCIPKDGWVAHTTPSSNKMTCWRKVTKDEAEAVIKAALDEGVVTEFFGI